MIDSIKRTLGFIQRHPLARRHLISAYLKAISWQLSSMFITKPIALRFIDQTKFLAQKGLTGITGNIYSGLHEFEDMGFLLHFLTPNDVFFDVGANVGSYTILASGVKKSKTITFEPIPTTYAILMKNIALNHLEGLVIVENKGVGKEKGTLNFTANGDTTNHIVTKIEDGVIAVDIVPLDSFYPEFRPSLIKIDVEGFETEVLNGATKILTDPTLKAIIIELNGCGERYGFDDESINKKLVTANFAPFSYDPFNRSLTKLSSFGKFNTIYIRDLDFVKHRLNTAAAFKVFNEAI